MITGSVHRKSHCYIYANDYCQGVFSCSGRANLPGTLKETIAESLWKHKHYEIKMGERR